MTQPPGADGDAPLHVRIDDITDASVVRRSIDADHVTRLAEILDACPPITVTADGALVDGRHRLAAARLRGWETIPTLPVAAATPAGVLLAAARANSAHGLPLTRAERRAAVERLLTLDAELSDRLVADACGVARSTVASARSAVQPCSGGRNGRLNARRGADGKRYPTARVAEATARAVVRLEPDLSVRALAERLGVSTGTAQRIRAATLAEMEREGRWRRLVRRLLARWLTWRKRHRAAAP